MLVDMKIKLFIINTAVLLARRKINLDTLRICPPQAVAKAHSVV
jgi:hypothetical protein